MSAFEQVIQEQSDLALIEELEQKIAPDGGETVAPLVKTHGH